LIQKVIISSETSRLISRNTLLIKLSLDIAAGNYHDSRHLLFPQPDGQHRYQYASRALFFHVMSALAEMERDLIVERTRAGLAVAREGRIGGCSRVMTPDVVDWASRMLESSVNR
jgi:hypothetical protein